MTPGVSEFITELQRYESEGPDDMDWAEWAAELLDEKFTDHFTLEDWQCIAQQYHKLSSNMQALLVGHIHLNQINFTDIQVHILTQMVINASDDAAFMALRKIMFCFVSASDKTDTNRDYAKYEPKGIYSPITRGALIKKYFTNTFKDKARKVANSSSDFFKTETQLFFQTISEF